MGGPGIRSAPVGAPAKISIDLPSPANECSVSVVAPSGRTILTNVGKQENHVTAQYVPTEIGKFENGFRKHIKAYALIFIVQASVTPPPSCTLANSIGHITTCKLLPKVN